jgi:hypothetical protein
MGEELPAIDYSKEKPTDRAVVHFEGSIDGLTANEAEALMNYVNRLVLVMNPDAKIDWVQWTDPQGVRHV